MSKLAQLLKGREGRIAWLCLAAGFGILYLVDRLYRLVGRTATDTEVSIALYFAFVVCGFWVGFTVSAIRHPGDDFFDQACAFISGCILVVLAIALVLTPR